MERRRFDIEIGDAVVPTTQWDHDVMTVYDFVEGANYSVARCNWLIGTRMFKLDIQTKNLRRVARKRKV